MTLLKSEMKRISNIYGNGAVCVADRKRVFEFLAMNFSMEPVHEAGSLSFDIQDEIVVSFGSYMDKAGAIEALGLVLKRIKAIPEAEFNPGEGDSQEVAQRKSIDNYWPHS